MDVRKHIEFLDRHVDIKELKQGIVLFCPRSVRGKTDPQQQMPVHLVGFSLETEDNLRLTVQCNGDLWVVEPANVNFDIPRGV